MHVELTIKQNLPTIIQCHKNAFRHLGIPREIVYDNIKTVVLKREKLPDGKFRVEYNLHFKDFADHFGFQIKLTPPYWPRSKGKVEAGVKYVRNNFFQGINVRKDKLSLDELNRKVLLWLDQVASVRKHGTTGKRPIDLWEKEKTRLRFPDDFPKYKSSPFVARNSTKDGLIQYRSNFYSVPIKFSRRKVYVRQVNKSGIAMIKVYHEGKLITSHQLSSGRGRWITKDSHLPSEMKLRFKNKQELEVQEILSSKRTRVSYARPKGYYDRLIPTLKHG